MYCYFNLKQSLRIVLLIKALFLFEAEKWIIFLSEWNITIWIKAWQVNALFKKYVQCTMLFNLRETVYTSWIFTNFFSELVTKVRTYVRWKIVLTIWILDAKNLGPKLKNSTLKTCLIFVQKVEFVYVNWCAFISLENCNRLEVRKECEKF